MATSKKSQTPKKTAKKPRLAVAARAKQRLADLRARRPHKSFRLTRRRDIPKPPALPGYLRFTRDVFRVLWKFRKSFAVLLLLYVIVATLLIGLVSQDQYATLTATLKQVGPDVFNGQLDTVTQALGLFGAAISGGLNASLGETQQLYLGLVYLVGWMVVIWLLRQLLAGNRASIRDALYNASAPLVSTTLIFSLMIIQALPAGIGVLIFSLATQDQSMTGAVAMLISLGAFLLIILSLYWLASSFFALLIVTLPGTYPMAAIRAAGDIALGRRLPLVLRLLWLALIVLAVWAIVLIPILFLDIWLSVSWLPLVPLTVQVLSGFSIIFATTYVYLLYREMINEPAK